MTWTTSLKAGLVQAAAVALLFALLVAAPLPAGFFRQAGALVGPLAWLGCALLTGRVLGLPKRSVLIAALAGGAVGAGLTVAGAHTTGLIGAVIAFGLACGLRLGQVRAAAR